MTERLWRKLNDAVFFMINMAVAWPWTGPLTRYPRKWCATAASRLWARQARKVLRQAGRL